MSEILKQMGSFLGFESEESAGEQAKDHKPEGVIETVYATGEWLLMAFSVTLVFIVFFMQAYTIPTGSMADTLRGAHFRLRCEQCGYRYEYGFLPGAYGLPDNVTPSMNVPTHMSNPRRPVRTHPPKCPSCGYLTASGQTMPVMKGDRIFVAKCIYQFTEPKRWDVIVFKNPTDPRINYIKRLIGKPGEEVEIIDGDIFIDGQIARKPDKVQEEMWMCVYDNDYQPIEPAMKAFNGRTWKQPFVNTEKSKWNLAADGPKVFSLDSDAGDMHTLVYDANRGNDFRATYAYNDPINYDYRMPICSDLMIKYHVLNEDWSGRFGAVLSKYGVSYLAMIDSNGRLEILKAGENGDNELLAGEDIEIDRRSDKNFRFYNADHQLVLEFGDHRISYDLGKGRADAGLHADGAKPEVMMFGGGKLKVGHVGVFRDLHYINDRILRAGEGDPFTLGEDEFFACGDNSPSSLDARLWRVHGKGNGGHEYRMGTVPRDYMIGKAFFVYWPGGFKAKDKSRIRLVPHIGGMKRIYGGQ